MLLKVLQEVSCSKYSCLLQLTNGDFVNAGVNAGVPQSAPDVLELHPSTYYC